MSSSGLVLPSGDSVRAPQLTGRSRNAPLDMALTVPLPVSRSPSQVASARRTAVMVVPPGPVARGGGDERAMDVGPGKDDAAPRRRTGGGRRAPRRTRRRSPGAPSGSKPSLPPQPEDAQGAGLAVDPRLDPADQPVAEQDRQDVVAPASLLLGDVDLPDVVEAVERAQEVAVPDVRIERGEEGDAGLDAAGPADRQSVARRQRGRRGRLAPVASRRGPRARRVEDRQLARSRRSARRGRRRRSPG